MVGVPGDAGDNVGIAGLHRARGAAKRDDAACPAHRDMVEPAWGETEVLGQADRCVREQGEAGSAQTVDSRLQSRAAMRLASARARNQCASCEE